MVEASEELPNNAVREGSWKALGAEAEAREDNLWRHKGCLRRIRA